MIPLRVFLEDFKINLLSLMKDLYFSGMWSCTKIGHEVAQFSLGPTANKDSKDPEDVDPICPFTSIIYFLGFPYL